MAITFVMKHVMIETSYASTVKVASFTERVVLTAVHE